jgi:hypothetical protein
MNLVKMNIFKVDGVSSPLIPLQRGRWIQTKVEKYIFTLLFVRGCNLFLREQVFRISPFGGGPRGRIGGFLNE